MRSAFVPWCFVTRPNRKSLQLFLAALRAGIEQGSESPPRVRRIVWPAKGNEALTLLAKERSNRTLLGDQLAALGGKAALVSRPSISLMAYCS